MRRRGFTITEMLWALILLSVVAALGTQVVGRCMTAIMAERGAAAIDASRSSFLRQVREDVWNATLIEVVNGSLVLSDGASEVRYMPEGEDVKRAGGGQEMQWPLHDIRFAADKAAVTVRLGVDDVVALAAPKVLAGVGAGGGGTGGIGGIGGGR